MIKMLIKRVIPTVVVLALVVLGGLWLYGYVGVKAGWIGPTEVSGLNTVSRSGARSAGGAVEAAKNKAAGAVESVKDKLGL